MNIEIMTIIVLSLTCIAIAWSSWETRQLRKWQKRQAQLSVIHMEMNRIISEHANGMEKSPGYLIGRTYKVQKKIIEEEDFDMKNYFDTNYDP